MSTSAPLRPFLRVAPDRAPVTAVYGGGGVFGIAYGLGVAHGLQEAGIRLEQCQAIGTSAGSWVASCLATGVGVDVLLAHPPVRVPNVRPGWLHGVASELFGDACDPRVRASAVRIPRFGRRLLDGAEHRLADLVAASSSVPGLFAPHLVRGVPYVDGGLRSMVSADQAPAADHLLVVAPVAGPLLGLGGRALARHAFTEVRRWEERTGGRAHVIRPNRAIAALARSPQHLFDVSRGPDVYALAREQAAHLFATRPALTPLAA
jgi:NTE family protein